MSSFFYILIIVLLFAYCFSLRKKLKAAKTNTAQVENENVTLKGEISKLDEKANNFQAETRSLREHIQNLDNHIETINQHYAYLKKFEPIKNVEDEIQQLWLKYQQDVETAKENYEQDFLTEKTKHKESLDSIKLKIASLQKESTTIISQANQQATEIVNTANANAKEIAGEAWVAKENAEFYEESLKALKRKIDGYGDEWIIPNSSLLDELADDYSFEEAGQNLKMYRNYSKKLSEDGKAGTCLYVEKQRRETAIRFVTEAFNGAVDSVLSKVKHDNYGTLRRQIQDAYNLIALNGRAFRDAKITEEYLNSRLLELEWATKTHALKLRDKEEQRRAKELMREEQKAKREYEKAMREAQKEEALIEKAMEKARASLEAAHEDEKNKYEKELEELRLKWEEAEERNKRAISMAQQTKRGHVYIISNIGSFGEDVYKIGMTRRLDPLDRVKELGDASVPFLFDVHSIIFSEDAPSLEGELHRKFDDRRVNKVNLRKEFFKVKISEIKEIVDAEGMDCHWTIQAKAAQFRESKAIESQGNSSENSDLTTLV
jgi:predicted nuclease with TOPRIM domain